MLADIYQVEQVLSIDISNIAELYNAFVESKIRIQYEERLNFQIEKAPDRYKVEHEAFYEDHIKLSSSSLYANNYTNEELIDKDKEMRIMKYGLIVSFKNGIPTFLHQSFAEFFLAKSFFQKIQQTQDHNEFEEVLRDEEYFLIRKGTERIFFHFFELTVANRDYASFVDLLTLNPNIYTFMQFG